MRTCFPLSDICISEPCNDGNCTKNSDALLGYTCTCPTTRIGDRCETGTWLLSQDGENTCSGLFLLNFLLGYQFILKFYMLYD